MAMIESKHRATSDEQSRARVLKQIEEQRASSTSSSGSPTSRAT